MASTLMESFFQRTLEDLVKGLRVQMIGESRYIANHLEEIRKEIKSTDPHTKTVALQKLTYINMLSNVDMDWAAFHVIEAMSMTKFSHKKIGYLAASQSFHDGTDVLLLVTNQLRKDLNSNNDYEAGMALECLSCIATPDLAQELTAEVFALLASGRAYVRTRATLVIFKIFTKYPDAVRIACKRLVEKLEDIKPKVLSASVSVFCEMAMKDPASCIPLAPEFYRLLVESKDNWLRIKVVKIFGALVPLEPRLGLKIAEPLCEIMRHTSAKSLLLECIRTVIVALPDHAETLKLAVQKLKELLDEDDPNLMYLGLQALATLMPAHPWVVAENKSMIIRCLNDEDHNIQLASLQLILGMVSEDNVIDTVDILLQYAERSESGFCNEVIGDILATCSRGVYEIVPDFTWYVSILGRVARIRDLAHGKEVERQFVDLGIRVKELRPDLLAVARGLVLDSTLLDCPSLHCVLSAVAWIVGEYVEFSVCPYELIEALIQPRTKLLPPPVQAVYLQAVLKVFVFFVSIYLRSYQEHDSVTEAEIESGLHMQGLLAEKDVFFSNTDDTSLQTIDIDSMKPTGTRYASAGKDSFNRLLDLLESNIAPAEHVDVEVRERRCNLFGVIKALGEVVPSLQMTDMPSQHSSVEKASQMIGFLRGVFSKELGPVSVFAQSRVPVPDGLVVMKNLDTLDGLFNEESKEEPFLAGMKVREWEVVPSTMQNDSDDDLKHVESSASLARHRQRHGTYYLPVEKSVATRDEYPSPQSTQLDAPSTSSATEDIMRLAERSLSWTKPRKGKSRPKIVRLDDADEDLMQAQQTKRVGKDNVISSAIKDVVLEAKGKRLNKHVEKDGINSSRHHIRKTDLPSLKHDENGIHEAKQINVDNSENSVKEQAKKKHGKHRHKVHGSTVSTVDTELRSQEDAHRNTEHRSRRHRRRSPATVPLQVDVIPDFLL